MLAAVVVVVVVQVSVQHERPFTEQGNDLCPAGTGAPAVVSVTASSQPVPPKSTFQSWSSSYIEVPHEPHIQWLPWGEGWVLGWTWCSHYTEMNPAC